MTAGKLGKKVKAGKGASPVEKKVTSATLYFRQYFYPMADAGDLKSTGNIA